MFPPFVDTQPKAEGTAFADWGNETPNPIISRLFLSASENTQVCTAVKQLCHLTHSLTPISFIR